MKEIITNLEMLAKPASPLEFITDTGIEKEPGLEIIAAIKEVMDAKPEILALSAPQIGYDSRIFCIRFNDGIKTFIDPIIKKKSGGQVMPETFVSMPGKEILVNRPIELTVVYYTDEFKYEDNKLLGPAARLFDQQVQLLDGILPSDIGLVSDVEQDGSLADLNEEEIAELTEIYKQFIKIKAEKLQAEIGDNEEAQKQYRELKFMERVVSGDAAIVDAEQYEREKRASAAQKKAEAKANTIKFLKRKCR